MTIVIFKVLVVLFLNDSRLCNRTLDAELKPIIHTCNFEVKRMRNSLIACSHQTPDLSTYPVHSVFAFGLAAPLSCMYSASSKLVHRSRQSPPRSMLDKSEPTPYKPLVSGAYQHQMV